jgi:hypothetical protein
MAEGAVAHGLWQAKQGISVEYPVALLVGEEHCVGGLPLMAKVETADDHGVRKVVRLVSLIDGAPLPTHWNRLPPMVGFIDILDLTGAIPEVVDHKTSKNRKYTLSPAKLAVDVQMLNYAAVALNLVPTVSDVKLRHNCFLKSSDSDESVYAVRSSTSRQSVIDHWQTIIRDVQDMETARRIAPLTAGRAEERAKNAHLLKAAYGTPDERSACNAYGGCAFRDYCAGRCDHIQIVKRLEQGGATARSPPRASFGLTPPHTIAGSTVPARINQENRMLPAPATPLAPQSFHMSQEVYICDPQHPEVQYRGIIVNAGNPPSVPPLVLCFPDAAVEPDSLTFPREYCVQPPISMLSAVQLQGVRLVGYAEALVQAGRQAPAWQPAKVSRISKAPLIPAPEAPVTFPVPSGSIQDNRHNTPATEFSRPVQDGQFGIMRTSVPNVQLSVGGDRNQVMPTQPAEAVRARMFAAGHLAPGVGDAMEKQRQRVAAEAEAQKPPVTDGYKPLPGDGVMVRQTDHPFWGQLSGSEGQILDVTDGIDCPMVTVRILDQEYESVAASRLRLVSRNFKIPGVPASPTFEHRGDTNSDFRIFPPPQGASDGQMTLPETAGSLKGQQVSLHLVGIPVPFNGVLEEVGQDEQGWYVEMFKQSPKPLKAYMSSIAGIQLFTAENVPSTSKKKDKKPKPKVDKEQPEAGSLTVSAETSEQIHAIKAGLISAGEAYNANMQKALAMLDKLIDKMCYEGR